jgi:PadR family transcriptional regulator PadR
MVDGLDNWKTQIRKGYLELCLLLLIQRHKRLYGFELLEKLAQADLPLKEGTLYPLLNRMTADGTLHAVWETENLKGHPRKFYSLTKEGTRLLQEMRTEFGRMVEIFEALRPG